MFAKEIFSMGCSTYVYPLSSKHMANESRALLSSGGEPVLGLDRAGALPLVFTSTADQTLGSGESQPQLRGKCSAYLLNAMMKNGINWKHCLWYFFCLEKAKYNLFWSSCQEFMPYLTMRTIRRKPEETYLFLNCC